MAPAESPVIKRRAIMLSFPRAPQTKSVEKTPVIRVAQKTIFLRLRRSPSHPVAPTTITYPAWNAARIHPVSEALRWNSSARYFRTAEKLYQGMYPRVIETVMTRRIRFFLLNLISLSLGKKAYSALGYSCGSRNPSTERVRGFTRPQSLPMNFKAPRSSRCITESS